MARLPVPGDDADIWGDILNDFLAVSHLDDGRIRVEALPTPTVADGSITPAKLSQAYVPLSTKAQPNGVASLDATGRVPISQIPGGAVLQDATTGVKGIVQLAGDLGGTADIPTVPGLAGKYVKPAGGIPETDLDSSVQTKLNSGGVGDATSSTKGIIQLTGDLGGTASTPTVPGLASRVSTSAVGAANGVASLDGAGKVPVSQLPAMSAADATTTSKGIVQLAGDLGGTAASPTVPGLVGKADDTAVVHKATNETITGVKVFTSSPEVPDPTVGIEVANKQYVDAAVAGGGSPDATTLTKGIVQLAGDLGGTAASPTVPGLANKVNTSAVGAASGVASLNASTKVPIAQLPDATTLAKGIVQLAGDLGGTAASPTVPGLANKIDTSEKGAASGVATLDGTGKVPSAQLPAMSAADATTTSKGIVQLAGDLGGTAAAPSVDKLGGISLPGSAPSNGQVLTATSASTTTWQTPSSGFADPTTTKGDIIVHDTTSTTRLGVGADGQVLTADSAQTEGVKWATPTAQVNADWNSASGASQILNKPTLSTVATSGSYTDLSNKPTVPVNLDDLSDVNTAGVSDGQVLTFDSGTTTWISSTVTSTTVNDATTGSKGIVQLAGDLGGTAASPTVPGLANKIDTSEKGAASGVATLDGTGKVPAAQLPAMSAADATTTSKGIVQLAGDLGGTAAAPTVPGLAAKYELPVGGIPEADLDSSVQTKLNAGASISDATTSSKGIVQLAGDLGGTAASPTVPGLANKANTSTTVTGTNSVSGGGDLTANRTLSLVNDSATPGNSKYYGTDGTGTKGFFSIPTGDPTMGGDLSGTASNAQIVANAVGTTEIADGAVTSAKIADDTIVDADIATTAAIAQSKISGLTTSLSNKVNTSAVGAANGVASLDSGGKVPSAQLPVMSKLPAYSHNGTLSITTGSHRLYNDSGTAWTIASIRASAGIAPTGAAIIVDVNISGTTVFTTQANRPTIADGTNTSGKVTNMNVTSVPDGSYLTVDIDQVGSSVTGSNLTVQIEVY